MIDSRTTAGMTRRSESSCAVDKGDWLFLGNLGGRRRPNGSPLAVTSLPSVRTSLLLVVVPVVEVSDFDWVPLVVQVLAVLRSLFEIEDPIASEFVVVVFLNDALLVRTWLR